MLTVSFDMLLNSLASIICEICGYLLSSVFRLKTQKNQNEPTTNVSNSLYPSFLFSDSLHELPIHFFRLMLKLAAETVLLFKCSEFYRPHHQERQAIASPET